MKKILIMILVMCCVLSFATGCFDGGGTGSSGTKNAKETEFHDLVAETQGYLDEYADDIYSCWYDYIYEDEYSSIEGAILAAMLMNTDNTDKIESNNETIKSLYGELKESELRTELKAVMQAYNEYYSLVMEVSGSFNSYSASKENLKKELATALKNLSFEL